MMEYSYNTHDQQMTKEFIKIGLVSISDRASSGIYEDKGIPNLQSWLELAVKSPLLKAL